MKTWVPKDEIAFAAKFGFLTRDLWLRFFETGGRTSQYVRWNRLTERQFFNAHPAARSGEVLVLNRANSWKFCFGDPVNPPPLAQLRHDELAASGALRLERGGLVSGVHSEAELKRTEFDWHNSLLKFPDLLVQVADHKIAIELELTQKSRDRYRKLGESFLRRSDLRYIIVVVPNKAIMNAIVRAFGDVETEIGFMKLECWQKDPCSGQIALAKSAVDFRVLNRELSKKHRELSSR